MRVCIDCPAALYGHARKVRCMSCQQQANRASALARYYRAARRVVAPDDISPDEIEARYLSACAWIRWERLQATA